MLALTLKPDDFIVIGNVVIRGIRHAAGVRLAIAAPDATPVHRLDHRALPTNLSRKIVGTNPDQNTLILSCGHQVPPPVPAPPPQLPASNFHMLCPHCAAECQAIRPLIQQHFSVGDAAPTPPSGDGRHDEEP